MQSYILWALLGMVGYSFTTLFVKLAERSSDVSTYMVLAVSTTIVSIFAIGIVAIRGEFKPLIFDLERGTLMWAIAGGIALTVAVSSLFHAHSMGAERRPRVLRRTRTIMACASWRAIPSRLR